MAFTMKPPLRALSAAVIAELAPFSQVTGSPRSTPRTGGTATLGDPSVMMNMMFGASPRSLAVLAAPVLTARPVGVSPFGALRLLTAVVNVALET
jgi:hypothetical protein